MSPTALAALDVVALLNSPLGAAIMLGLFGLAVTCLHHFLAVLRADGQKRGGALGKLEVGAADLGDEAVNVAQAQKQNVVALVDPAKRGAAIKALEDAGVKDAEALVDAKLKGGS